MRSTRDVVVVGGGVVGASIAFHCARLQAGSVTLLERHASLAEGASGSSGALVRTHYTDEPEARMAWAAVPWFEEWADRVGGSCGFVRTGFLQLVHRCDAGLLRKNVAVLQRLGIETSLVTSDEIRSLQPGLRIADDESAAFEPRSGYADPVATTHSLADAARRLGAEIRTGEPVRALRVEGSRVVGVDTSSQSFDAGVVVLANGSWSVPLLREIGIDVPIEPYRAQAAILDRPRSLVGSPGHLTLIDRRYGIYARPADADGTLVGLSRAAPTQRLASPDDVDVEEHFPEQARKRIARAIPAFRDSVVRSTQAGPLDVTPDRCCLLGPLPGIDQLVLAVGMSGSGFKKAPALGACIAELIVEGEATTAPIDPFRPGRFDDDATIQRSEYRVGDDPDDARDALVH
ncbi:MAG: NAD(P)/FAD-dependent oxidoreductase [Streptosporangiales bacterium]